MLSKRPSMAGLIYSHGGNVGLAHKLRTANRFLARMTENERLAFLGCCQEIQRAQEHLNRTCGDAFQYCMARCEGKCCRNLHIDAIVTTLDCLFILALNPHLFPELRRRAGAEGIFSADCPFLLGGVGPCLFPADQKPEQCIITFCAPVVSARQPVRKVRAAFSRLWRHVLIRRPFFWLGW